VSDSGIQLETVNFFLEEGVARIELNRPDSLNSWNGQFGDDLLAAVARCREDEAVRAVLVTGAGRGFSSGADLRELGGGASSREEAPDAVYRQLTEVYHPIMTGIRELPKPVVAAVNGPAVGIGCSLALCCDLILAAESAYFLLAFVNIGLVPDGGSSVWLPSRIGLARATELCMLGERLGASQALEWGLINRVVADGELLEVAGGLVARSPTRAPSASSTTGSTSGWTSSSTSRRRSSAKWSGARTRSRARWRSSRSARRSSRGASPAPRRDPKQSGKRHQARPARA
jgi:2-(1,2-epoxy-1,2-dihydrophenyl)acetyl-CoA isomerase